jgi:serine/threonine-protein kinase
VKTLVITLTRDGRPLSDVDVTFDGGIERRSDSGGVVSASLPSGRVQGHVTLPDGTVHSFVVVNAQGLRRVRVAVTGSMAPLEDEGAKATMPSDRYEPLAWLGAGAMGRVLKARDTHLDRIVAVKVLPAEVAPSPEDRELFISEGRALARVAHPNLLGVYDVGIKGAVPYLVVEYVDGPDLLALVEATGPLPYYPACAAGAQLCRALDALHHAGLVHRDVKPSNGLVDTQGRVVLADFGLVRPLDDVADPRSQVLGTPGFMSPEHMQGQPLGPATDIYALGSTLYNLIAGEIPLAGPRLLLRHLTDERPDLREVRPDAPEALAELIMAMMAIDPTDRPSAGEARETLESIAASVEVDVLGPFMPRLGERTIGSAALPIPSGSWLGPPGSGSLVAGARAGAGAAGRTTPGPPVGDLFSAANPDASEHSIPEMYRGTVTPLSMDSDTIRGPRTSQTGPLIAIKRSRGTAVITVLALVIAVVAIVLALGGDDNAAQPPDDTAVAPAQPSEGDEQATTPPPQPNDAQSTIEEAPANNAAAIPSAEATQAEPATQAVVELPSGSDEPAADPTTVPRDATEEDRDDDRGARTPRVEDREPSAEGPEADDGSSEQRRNADSEAEIGSQQRELGEAGDEMAGRLPAQDSQAPPSAEVPADAPPGTVAAIEAGGEPAEDDSSFPGLAETGESSVGAVPGEPDVLPPAPEQIAVAVPSSEEQEEEADDLDEDAALVVPSEAAEPDPEPIEEEPALPPLGF